MCLNHRPGLLDVFCLRRVTFIVRRACLALSARMLTYLRGEGRGRHAPILTPACRPAPRAVSVIMSICTRPRLQLGGWVWVFQHADLETTLPSLPPIPL